MNPQQPNFERLKTAFYRAVTEKSHSINNKMNYSLLMEGIFQGKLNPSFYKRKEQFIKDLNKWLDSVDIRTAGELIDNTLLLGGELTQWIKDKKFYIDYNEKGFLDLIHDIQTCDCCGQKISG